MTVFQINLYKFHDFFSEIDEKAMANFSLK